VPLEDIIEDCGTALTVKDVADILKVSPRLIYQLVQIGEMPHFRVGKTVRFEPHALSSWLREKMREKGQEKKIDRCYSEMERTSRTGASLMGGVLLRLLWEKVLRPQA
jgi:excisionase family DNA binding protein